MQDSFYLSISTLRWAEQPLLMAAGRPEPLHLNQSPDVKTHMLQIASLTPAIVRLINHIHVKKSRVSLLSYAKTSSLQWNNYLCTQCPYSPFPVVSVGATTFMTATTICEIFEYIYQTDLWFILANAHDYTVEYKIMCNVCMIMSMITSICHYDRHNLRRYRLRQYAKLISVEYQHW